MTRKHSGPVRPGAGVGPRRSERSGPTEENPEPRPPMGRWLLENMPQGANLDSSADRRSRQEVPFGEETDHST